MRHFTKSIYVVAALTCVALPSTASAEDAPLLRIENYLGMITIRTEDGVDLNVQRTKRATNLNVVAENDRLLIDGGVTQFKNTRCWQDEEDVYFSIGSKAWSQKDPQKLQDQTHLEIIAPPNVRVEIDNSFFTGEIGNIDSGDISLNHCGDLILGNVSGNAALATRGSGNLIVGNIGDGDVGLYGSGNISVENAKDIEIKLYGSGNINAKNLGAAKINLYGSGNITFDDVDGALSTTVFGSGNIRGHNVSGGLEASSKGSGNVDLTSINGPVSIEIMGSSHVDIDEGRATAFSFEGRGSGSVDFGGIAVNPNVDIRYSNSSITFGGVEGKLIRQGKEGRIKIKDRPRKQAKD